MVIAALIALQVAAAAPAAGPLTELPPQQLEPGRCALFLWDKASRQRIAMLSASPTASLRARIDGQLIDLPQASASGSAVMGFAPNARYRSAARQLDVAVTILPTGSGGAVVRDGSLTVTEADGSALVIPVAGILGCR
ncbi:hypothetical protein CHU93_16550 [Sandarakinorhabdus cyanobacteriorum]|uniref:Uncharacterized protein n=1 Tax=Sandarakinorhabdus cyanobacteriorum TaxID=1981098 RepID=A0A255Y5S4_9SPHN|nr:hypothetical protein [Sandarakinorhabdus cyanobacteriorum]OYQ24034.1 hypothetical protein CHU93_16550 [Sandarakinorhabdus cyanobacteriorum]